MDPFLIDRERRRGASTGFTLIEIVITMFLATVITLSSIGYFATISRAITRPVINYNNQNYALAPIIRDTPDGVAKTDLFDALDLHRELTRQIDSADFVAVFGGSNSDAAAPAPLLPLVTSFGATSLPSLIGLSPAGLNTTNRIAAAAAVDLGGSYETSADPADFTVVVFQAVSDISAIAQVRRHQTNYLGQAVSLYETTMSSRTPPATTWSNYSYRFWLPAAEDTWSVPMGARHAWFRTSANWWDRNEEAGATVAFPDPYVLSVPTADATVLAHSRFTYFVSASPAF